VGNFVFRLQKVFEYRELEEQWAKDNFLEKQVARLRAEEELAEIQNHRRATLQTRADDLHQRLELELRLQKSDDHERMSRLLIIQLQQEEDIAREEYIERKQAKSALEKLREKAKDLWNYSELRLEQNAMDEWSTQQKRAA
jgi:flagellar export protein FliJ